MFPPPLTCRYFILVEPEFKYIGNMHGDEVVGREILQKLAIDLCEKYKAEDADVVKLLQITRIHILPTMNPDGWQVSSKYYLFVLHCIPKVLIHKSYQRTQFSCATQFSKVSNKSSF